MGSCTDQLHAFLFAIQVRDFEIAIQCQASCTYYFFSLLTFKALFRSLTDPCGDMATLPFEMVYLKQYGLPRGQARYRTDLFVAQLVVTYLLSHSESAASQHIGFGWAGQHNTGRVEMCQLKNPYKGQYNTLFTQDTVFSPIMYGELGLGFRQQGDQSDQNVMMALILSREVSINPQRRVCSRGPKSR